MRRSLLFFVVLGLLCVAVVAIGDERHVTAQLLPVNGSGVTGTVELTSLPKGGTLITVVAQGLRPNTPYLSLYYENHSCDLEPYEEDDVIARYTAGPSGVGHGTRKVGDDLDEINSVSVRLASDFSLQACADVHP